MLLQKVSYGMDALNYALLKLTVAKRRFHVTANLFPGSAANLGMYAAIRDNFHVMVARRSKQNPCCAEADEDQGRTEP